ncbi:MAG TPA: hypothetical protein VFI22_13485, partial [Thermomicrobiales bacterium]|nr:hypothetical protein [Thermomicrobiales bacterium]
TQSNTIDSSIKIQNGDYSSPLTAYGNTNVRALAIGGDINFAGDVELQTLYGLALLDADNGNLTVRGNATLYANAYGDNTGGAASVTATSAGTVSVEGDLNLNAQGYGFNGLTATGGPIGLSADGGTISVTGAIVADATANGGGPGDSLTSPSAIGGNVAIEAINGGNISAGSLAIDNSATGAYAFGQSVAGNGTGGNVQVKAESGSAIVIGGPVDVASNGFGGASFDDVSQPGTGTGGNVLFLADGGSIDLGDATINADGTGGSFVYGTSTDMSGGDATGGTVRFEIEDAASAIHVAGVLEASADAFAGDGFNGGLATGGKVGIEAFGGSMSVDGSTNPEVLAIDFSANADGGDAIGIGGNGGNAQGGLAYVQAEAINAATSTISAGDVGLGTNGNIALHADADGGLGGDGDGVTAAGAGGSAQGGYFNGQLGSGGVTLLADANGGRLSLGSVELSAVGTGGQGGNGGIDPLTGLGQQGGSGGSGSGGSVQAGEYTAGHGINSLGQVTIGDLSMDVSAWGGDGGFGSAGSAQGDG